MASLADLRPGDIGFGPVHGGAGWIVGAGQVAVAPFDHWAGLSKWHRIRHCGWVVQASTGSTTRGAPLFAQAMPSGFETVEMGAEHWTDEWIYIRPDYISTQPDAMASIGRRMAGKKIPYGFEDYAAIAGHRLGLHSQGLDDFIARTDGDGDPRRAICSQAVDAALTLAGGLDGHGKVFDDERLPQDVTPAELYLRLLQLDPGAVILPGR